MSDNSLTVEQLNRMDIASGSALANALAQISEMVDVDDRDTLRQILVERLVGEERYEPAMNIARQMEHDVEAFDAMLKVLNDELTKRPQNGDSWRGAYESINRLLSKLEHSQMHPSLSLDLAATLLDAKIWGIATQHLAAARIASEKLLATDNEFKRSTALRVLAVLPSMEARLESM
jgi:hypothetical protein